MSRNLITGLAVGLGLFAGMASAKSAQITEVENNNTFLTAQSIDAHFTDEFNANILDSTLYPHVSVLGRAPLSSSPSFDNYKFTVTTPGTGIFDIDFGYRADATTLTETDPFCPGPGCINTRINLFNSVGTLLFTDDNSGILEGAGGSFFTGDSFRQYEFSSAGIYFIQVGHSSGGPLPATNGNYMLQVSIEDHALMNTITVTNTSTSVPEPATLALFGIGLLGLGAARRQRQSA